MATGRDVEQKLSDITSCIGAEDFPKATQLLYTLIRTLTKNAEGMIDLRTHAQALCAARNKGRRVGLGSCTIPLPNVDNTEVPPHILFEFDELGSYDNTPTVEIRISDNAPLEMKYVWQQYYNFGKITIPENTFAKKVRDRQINKYSLINCILAPVLLFVSQPVQLALCILPILFVLFTSNYNRKNALNFAYTFYFWNFITLAISFLQPGAVIICSIIAVSAIIGSFIHAFIRSELGYNYYHSQDDPIEISSAYDMHLPAPGPTCPNCKRISLQGASFCAYCRTAFANNLLPAPVTDQTIALRPKNKV